MNLWLLSLLHLLLFVASTSARTRSPTCLRQFDTNSDLYEPCKSSICILFKDDAPLDDLGPSPHPSPGVPFRCNDRESLFPGLKGVFFRFQRNIPQLDNPYCIYASNTCKYDDLVKFLVDAAQVDTGHRFIIGGTMFLVGYRLSNSSIASVPFYDGKMLFFGPRRRSAGVVLNTVWSAFTLGAWIFVLGTFTVLFIVRALIMYYFTAPTTSTELWWIILDDPARPEVNEEVREYDRLLFWSSKWRFTTKATVFIVLMVFEAGFVSYLFEQSRRGPEIQIQNLTKKQLQSYAVVENSAEEFFFRSLVDQDGEYDNSIPWTRCKDSSDVFSKILNSTHPAKFGLTYEHFGKLQLRDRKVCDKVTIYRSSDITQKYNTVWYYGSISQQHRQAINKGITNLVEKHQIQGLMRTVPDEEDPCGEQPFSVDWIAFLVPVAIVVIPFCLLFAITTIIYRYCVVSQQAAEEEIAFIIQET